jgi:hypothetical protein
MSERALAECFGGEWKPHPANHSYFFSREGNAASITERGGKTYVKLLKGCRSGQQGYRAISHPIGGGRYGRIYIHRAVCELFVGEPPSAGLVVRHLDCNKDNNRASNLAWGTHAENALDGVRNGRIRKGPDSPNTSVSPNEALSMRLMRNNGYTYREIGEAFGVSRMTATRIVNHKEWV